MWAPSKRGCQAYPDDASAMYDGRPHRVRLGESVHLEAARPQYVQRCVRDVRPMGCAHRSRWLWERHYVEMKQGTR
jgi:hypothetical protein